MELILAFKVEDLYDEFVAFLFLFFTSHVDFIDHNVMVVVVRTTK